MSRVRMTKSQSLAILGVALLGAALLGGCGKLGSLERPAPLYGERAKAEYQAEKTAEAQAVADKRAGREQPTAIADQPDARVDNAPRTTRDMKTPEQKLTPLSQSPIDGAPNPFGNAVSARPPG